MERTTRRPASPRKSLGRLGVFGDSLATDYGATILDWGSTHKLSELMNTAPLRVAAVNGAIAARAQAGSLGDGGYAYFYAQNPRSELVGNSSLLTNAPAVSATTFTVTGGTGSRFAAGDTITIGGTNPENRVVTSVATDTITVPALSNSHAIGDPVYVNTDTYMPLEQLLLLVYGVNDMLQLGPDAGGTTNATLQPFFHAMRCMTSWGRASVVYQDDHPGFKYGANWSVVTGNSNAFSQGTAHSTTVSGSSVTFPIPGNYPGGYLTFYTVSAANGNGANFTITSAGGQFSSTTIDSRNQNFFAYNGTRAANGFATGVCKRILLPASGGSPYNITITATTVTGTAYIDAISLEATQPPGVLVTLENRPGTISQTGVPYPSRTATTLSAGTYNAGTTSWTVGSTAAWKIGDTVKIGTGSTSETLTVLTIPTGTTFTTAASANSHSAGDTVRAGFQDADITGISADFTTGAADGGRVALSGSALNVGLRAVCNEFDKYVLVFDKDPVFQRNSTYFLGSDGVHYDNGGHTELAYCMYRFVNSQTALTDRLLVSASVPNRRTWYPVQALPPGLVSFSNSWTNTSGGVPLQFYKDIATGLVVIWGEITQPTAANGALSIVTLPSGFRPAGNVVIVGESSWGPCSFVLTSAGVLSPSINVGLTDNRLYGSYLADNT